MLTRSLRCFLHFAALSTLFVLAGVASAQCVWFDSGSQVCCSGTKNCRAHCVTTSLCTDFWKGLDSCSTSYGACCDATYGMENASGERCQLGVRLRRSPNLGKDEPELVYVSRCSTKLRGVVPKQGD